MNAPRYLQAFNDAGLLREYAVRNFGRAIVHGGSASALRRASHVLRRLAKLTGLPIAEVTADVREDYEIAFA